jgi:hypothetical protein
MATTLHSLNQRRQNLIGQIESLPVFRRGTVIERRRSCGKPMCICQRDPEHLHVQYQWTASINGKKQFKNLHLGPETAKYLHETDTYRRFAALMEELILVNEEIADHLQAQAEEEVPEKKLAALKKKLRNRLSAQRMRSTKNSSQ